MIVEFFYCIMDMKSVFSEKEVFCHSKFNEWLGIQTGLSSKAEAVSAYIFQKEVPSLFKPFLGDKKPRYSYPIAPSKIGHNQTGKIGRRRNRQA